MTWSRSFLVVFCLSLLSLGRVSAPVRANEPFTPAIDFNRQIRPILSEYCFQCHGPDDKQRKARLRLDVREEALGHGSVIVPGKAAQSELIERVTSEDAHSRMPPAKSGKRLTPQQIDLLRQWIDRGAKWSAHWAFVQPQRPAVPAVANATWTRNPIDGFVLARLEAAGLQPSAEADKVTLIRRLTLDLTGLPPTPAEVDAFVADSGADAYERLVERLLGSPRYGERMAVDWLDAARFADTHGYHIDSGRDMTRWREWVIDAFNHNLPFDQFTVEQLAGDLLPNAPPSQRIASGFNRNHMINFEGGAIPEEYHTAYIVDRVNTTATVWLGLTMGCAQCHDHKYDPISQKEFYQVFAFFNNVPENGLDGAKGNAAPVMRTPTPETQHVLDQLDATIREVEAWAKSGPPTGATGKALAEQLTKLRQVRAELDKQVPTTMVMQEMPKPRDTFLLVRGQYDKRGEKVTAAVPAFLRFGSQDIPGNRLGLARWLVDPANPLPARVIVNRYWQMYFGTGLVKTAEDFGAQGEWPSHPELLDWLATEFIRTGWDVKQMQRLLVTSATYRQASAVTPIHLAKDPENRLLARASRLRLPAEFIRDQALAVSGLLTGVIGGKSVSPYQPPGLWEELASRLDGANWTAQTYRQDHGKDLYRRTMYTFWKRTSPPPTLATFDAPDREVCTVRRARTNTPLQALVLMNDPTYVEAARKLAERVMAEAGSTEERIVLTFRLAAARTPTTQELAVLHKVYESQLARYREDVAAATRLLAVGESKRNEALNVSELAAWSAVASVILNLDEVVTRG
jgi:hypothetical protein